MDKPYVSSRKSEMNHRKESLTRIFLPVIIITLVSISLFIIFLFSSSGNQDLSAQWGMVALIILILPFLMGGLILLALILCAVISMASLTRKVPGFFTHIDPFHQWLTNTANHFSAGITSPIIKLFSVQSSVQKLIHLIIRSGSTSKEKE